MCGIIGMMTNKPNTQVADKKSFIKQSIFVDTLRGFHSTGLMMLNQQDKSMDTWKRAVAGYDAIDMQSFNTHLNRMGSINMFIGHNRSATRGGVNYDNAHPFIQGSIVGVHNGTLISGHGLENYRRFGTDSEAIFHNFDEYGHDDIINKIDGAFALVWWNTHDFKMRIIRNQDRSLYYAICEQTESVYFASEPLMLGWIAARNGIKIGDVKPFEEMYEYIFTPGDVLNFETVKHEEYVSPPANHTVMGTYSNTYGKGNYSNITPQQQQQPKMTRKSEDLLSNLGFKKNDNISFMLFDWAPYQPNSTSLGRAYGWCFDGEYPLIVHGMSEDRFQNLAHKECRGPIVSVCWEQSNIQAGNKKKEPHLIVDAKALVVVNGTKSGSHNDRCYEGPDGLVTEEEFKKLVQDGCDHCTGPIHLWEHNELAWTQSKKPICTDCLTSFLHDDHAAMGYLN